MYTLLPVENNDILTALRNFLKSLLTMGVADGLYAPVETDKGATLQVLMTDPDQLGRANPLAPVMPINGARAVSAFTGKKPPARFAVVLRPCEIRALVELVKLQQASLEGVTIIGMDCPGTYDVRNYVDRKRNGGFDMSGYLTAGLRGQTPTVDGLTIRQACQMCVQPVPVQANIKIHLFGGEPDAGLLVEMDDLLAEKLDVKAVEVGTEPFKTTQEHVVGDHQKNREKELGAIKARMRSNGGIASLFDDCIRCHNCMTACPICYCKTCLFKTSAFDHTPDHYLTSAKRKGAVRMMGDTLLFHMTRMNHMSASCVSCGMCTSACPSDIPVGAIFSAVGEGVQTAFEYIPGRSVDEPLPLITFQPNEWTEVGEAK
jgi:formate dehydrogenase subunit beta